MWAALSLAGFLGAVAAHSILVRQLPRLNRVEAFLVLGALFGLALVLLVTRQYGFFTSQTLAAAFTYAFSCELYIFLFASSLTSISANILARLHLGNLSSGEIDAIYDSHRMVANRISRLLESGLMRETQGHLGVTEKGLRLLNFLAQLRRFFRHED